MQKTAAVTAGFKEITMQTIQTIEAVLYFGLAVTHILWMWHPT
jgi:hypothetical protein